MPVLCETSVCEAMLAEDGHGDVTGSKGLPAEGPGMVKGTGALTLKAVLSTSSLYGKLSQERTSVFAVC